MTLSEAEAKAALSHTGLTVPAARVVSLDDIDNQGDFPFPAVLKAQGLAHKSDEGGVALNLTSLDAVKSAAQNMGRDSFLMEQMITGAVCEILIGVVADPAHGFVLTLAAGGVMTEILKDSTTLVLPVTSAGCDRGLPTVENCAHPKRISRPTCGGYGRIGGCGDVRSILCSAKHE